MGAPILSQDHLGKWYSSIREMCDYWEIRDTLYHNRRRAGYSIEASLTGAGIKRNVKPSRDHIGQNFSSERHMCRTYGVSNGTYRDRIQHGWSTQDALMTASEKRIHGKEHIGISHRMNCGDIATIIAYSSTSDMLVAFEDGSVTKASFGNFNKGCVKHPKKP